MTDPNDQAFPSEVIAQANGSRVPLKGLTKREYFAAMAMQGFISAKLEDPTGEIGVAEVPAKAAVIMADALIKELSK